MSYIFFVFHFFFFNHINSSCFHNKHLALKGNQYIDIRPLIKVNTDHIRFFEISTSKKGGPRLVGLHHDYNLNFKKKGLVAYHDVVKGRRGAFGANVSIKNTNYGFKTLFSPYWSYNEIVKILIALCVKRYNKMTVNQYFKKITQEAFDGTVGGLLVRIVFDRMKFLVVSAYPLIEKPC